MLEEAIEDKKINGFIIDFVKDTYPSEKEYKLNYEILKKKYKLCPNKPTLLRNYRKLLK